MVPTNNSCLEIDCGHACMAYHRGPDLNVGPLPTLVYFSLSGYESLMLDPYCQPVDFWLHQSHRRAISFDLPEHPMGGQHTRGMEKWADKMGMAHQDIISPFVKQIVRALKYLQDKGWIDVNQLVIGGLSRGAFLATHVAAKEPSIRAILGYAPLTTLETIKEFQSYLNRDEIRSLGLSHLVEALIYKKLRFYIGNLDQRVGTQEAFQFIEKLAVTAHQAGIRSPQAELIIYPSVGHKGHGTLPSVFKEGINWLNTIL